MVTSESTKAIFAAIAEFQKTRPAVVKSKKGGRNNSYAPLDAVMDAVDKPLADAGLFVSHPISVVDGKSLLETRVIHLESGEWISSTVPLLLEQQTNQGIGSAITYMRRYALLALLGIAPDDDDDGEGANRGAAVATVREKRQQKPAAPSLKQQILDTVNAETNPERARSFTDRIAKRVADGDLSEADAKDCRAAVAQRVAALVSQAASKGKLFDDTPKQEGVGV